MTQCWAEHPELRPSMDLTFDLVRGWDWARTGLAPGVPDSGRASCSQAGRLAGWQAGRLFGLLVSVLRISLWTENLAGKVQNTNEDLRKPLEWEWELWEGEIFNSKPITLDENQMHAWFVQQKDSWLS